MMYYTSSDEEPELESLDISNDQYYRPLAIPTNRLRKFNNRETLRIPRYGSKTIRHSLPAYDLWKPFFPTYMSEEKFRNFHRPKLRHFNTGPQAKTRRGSFAEHPIKSLSRHIFRCQKKLRNKVLEALEEGLPAEEIVEKMLLIKEAKDLTAKSGELFLFEYCEEHPPVLSQVGMASNIKTYCYETQQKNPTSRVRPKASSSQPSTQSKTPEPILNASQPQQKVTVKKSQLGYQDSVRSEKHAKQIYYNQLKPGSTVRMIENNLYRAPIYDHRASDCDFIVIRTRNSLYIRPLETIFAVGQTFPLLTVPSPTEAQIQKFRCDLSNVYIHKLFKASETEPPSIKLDILCRLFPDYHRSVLQRRIRSCGAKVSILNREAVYLQGESNYGKISIDDLRRMVRPECYCLNMSTLAARQRLRELNYTESMIHPPKEVTDLEPEVLAAPWNTSKAISSVLKGQAYLDLEKHTVDPTGSVREGFSCVAWVKSPTQEQQIKEMSLSTPHRARVTVPLEKNALAGKITQEKLKRLAIYQREAQHIADIQSKILSDPGLISSSEDEYDAEDENESVSDGEFKQQLEDLSRLVIEGQSVGELNYEKEEKERRQMLSEFKISDLENIERRESTENGTLNSKLGDDFSLATIKNKVLIITRTYDHAGVKIQRTEVVREPRIIALYVKQKGGTLKTAPADSYQDHRAGDQHDLSINSTKSDGAIERGRFRQRSSSLGPTELCRADGTVLRISKKVLEHVRPLRNCRR